MTDAFALPPDAEATAPPEWRGLARDEVRLMAVRPGRHRPRTGSATSPTCSRPATSSWSTPRRPLPGAARRPGARTARSCRCTWSTHARRRRLGGRAAPSGQRRPRPRRRARRPCWRCPAASGCTLLDGVPRPGPAVPAVAGARRSPAVPTPAYLARHGQPIRYGYLAATFPLADLPERVRRPSPGSAEMASAGRPFTDRGARRA